MPWQNYQRDLLLKNKASRRARMIAARAKGTHTKEQWEQLKDEFDQRCVRCQSADCKVEKDHVIPVYQGGSDGIENIQPLCAWCNAGKGPETFNWAEFRREVGWTVAG